MGNTGEDHAVAMAVAMAVAAGLSSGYGDYPERKTRTRLCQAGEERMWTEVVENYYSRCPRNCQF